MAPASKLFFRKSMGDVTDALSIFFTVYGSHLRFQKEKMHFKYHYTLN